MIERSWDAADAAKWISVPTADDDKYSRGVLGVAAGSAAYPGAAVLVVDAALRTGIGMVRYLAPERPPAGVAVADYVLAHCPETVIGAGRVSAWVAGSGMEENDSESTLRIEAAIAAGVPAVLDAAAIPLAESANTPVVVTPHAGELARLLGTQRTTIIADPISAAREAAIRLGSVVLLKGATTRVVAPDGNVAPVAVAAAPTWLATAGAGDVLSGVLGALVATRAAREPLQDSQLVALAATAAFVHGTAATLASAGGPLTVREVCRNIPAAIVNILRSRGARV